jgi:hypothetical protein
MSLMVAGIKRAGACGGGGALVLHAVPITSKLAIRTQWQILMTFLLSRRSFPTQDVYTLPR